MDITNYLVLGLPIPIEGLGKIYQPTIQELIEHYKDVESFFTPYLISIKLYEKYFTQEILKTIKDFDLFFLVDAQGKYLIQGREKEGLIEDLVYSLTLLYKTNNVILNFEKEKIIIDNMYEINRYNFDLLSEYVMKIGMKEKIVPEKKEVFKSERKRKLYEKLEKRRAEIRRRNAPILGDFINTLANNPVRGYSYEEIRKMTIWQILKCYSEILNIDRHEQMMKYKVSYKYNVEDEIEHWRKTNKLERVNIN